MTEALLLTIAEAARAMSCSTRLVEKLIASGDLRSLRLSRRARRVPRAAIVDYIESRLDSTSTDPVTTAKIASALNKHATARGWTPRRSKKEARTSGTPSKQG